MRKQHTCAKNILGVILGHTVPENVKKMKNYLESILSAPVYNPLGLNLSIKVSWQHLYFPYFEFR